jgi:hypothetical protein
MWISAVIKVGSDGTTVSVSRYMLGLFAVFIVVALFVARLPRLSQVVLVVLALTLLSFNLCMFLLWGWVA